MIKSKVIGYSLKLLKIACLLLVLLTIYYAIFHPLISMLFLTIDYTEDINYYNNDSYLKHKYGKKLKEYISSIEYLKNGEIVYFYYGDNFKHDNPIYGKICDVIAVDIKIDEGCYAALKKSDITKNHALYKFNDSDRYELYYPKFCTDADYITFFALNDESFVFRAILISDADGLDAYGITQKLVHWTCLSFE